LIEAFAAILALVQSHLGMGSQVIRQMCQLLETSPTFVALMWLLSCVSVSMNLHVDLLVESLSAEVTNERLVVGVRAHMSV